MLSTSSSPLPDRAPAPASPSAPPLRRFAPSDRPVWSTVRWEQRDAVIRSVSGEVLFEERAVEVPASWSHTATNVVISRYLHGAPGTPQREVSVRALIARVCDTIASWGLQDGYFDAPGAEAFRDDLRWLCLHQHLAFNSPVWFNVGTRPDPQCSACFINSVQDSMESILDLTRTEGMLFKQGSGSGANLSAIRGSGEALSGGGTASGPLAFMRGFDAMAGAIKSGGKNRRAARMVMLDDTHPDVLEFARCKAAEEAKAHALIDAGYDGSFNAIGGAYDSVAYQNANHSIRLSDAFMAAAERDGEWSLRAVTDGAPIRTLPARELLAEIAQSSWLCGDPGVQFSDTVSRWHTCPDSGPIRASNPCGEFIFLDDTACNLASLNLLAFLDEHGEVEVERLQSAVELAVTAMDILVSRASYPTARIAENSHRFRPLGLGYSNLGALLMARACPYDSPEGRQLAAAITALMTGHAYAASAELARRKGPFDAWEENRAAMDAVLARHAAAAAGLKGELREVVQAAWEGALDARSGYRNAQVTLLAPTGTISFMMDCDTTGVEPELALIKTRTLVGGGSIRMVNGGVCRALERLGYGPTQRAVMLSWLEVHGTLKGAPGLAEAHLPVFDCALGDRPIAAGGHIAMMAAVQPFISGAISKTINLPAQTTPEQIQALLLDGWRRGLKSLTIYRDGSKRTQPIQAGPIQASTGAPAPTPDPDPDPDTPHRRRLPDVRQALTHKFSIDGHDGYLTVGLYEDGRPGELFLVMAKEGSVISGLVNVFATSVSMALQYGVPLEVLCDKFAHTRFEPSGFTGNRDVPFASSITDYVFRWLQKRFIGEIEPVVDTGMDGWQVSVDVPPCPACGALMVTSGTCYKCANCGGTSGCS